MEFSWGVAAVVVAGVGVSEGGGGGETGRGVALVQGCAATR
jgi:hypothetical protein